MKNPFEGLLERDVETFDYIHKSGPVTKKELISKLEVKLTTLNRSMAALEKRNLICEIGEAESTGGRKPTEYDVAREGVYAVGVDISRLYTEIVVINLKAKILGKYRFDMDLEFTPKRCVDKIAGQIETMLQQLSIDKGCVLGIGIGTVGPLDRNSGVLQHPQGFMNSEWLNIVPINDMLEAKTGLPCCLDNGANTAVLAEYLFGQGRGRSCVAYIHCGIGIRSSVIKEGLILRTLNDREDAFAHMTVQFEVQMSTCGSQGSIESYASLESIRRGYMAFAEKQEDIPYRELFRLAARHDPNAVKVLDEAAKVLGVGIANLARLLDVELVILSGPLVAGYGGFYTKCMEFVQIQSIKRRIEYAKEGFFGEDVVAAGAGLMVIENNIGGGRKKQCLR